jgi:hypothetical protein
MGNNTGTVIRRGDMDVKLGQGWGNLRVHSGQTGISEDNIKTDSRLFIFK